MRAGRQQGIVEPGKIAAAAGIVYVTDVVASHVVALDAHDGKTRWTFGDEPVAGTRLGTPTDLAFMPNGDIAVADPANRRIVVLGTDGHVRRVIAQPSPVIHSMCVLSDSSFLIVVLNPSAPIIHLGSNGDILSTIESPWKGFTNPGQVQGLLLHAANGDGCTYMLQTGTGFSTVTGKGFGPIHAYIETNDSLPELTTAVSVVAAPATIAILYRGQSPDRFRLIDLYDLRSLAYRESVVLPTKSRWLARSQGSLIAIEKENDSFAIVAWQLAQGLSSILP